MEVKSSSESSSEGKGGAGSFPSFILLRSTHFVLRLSVPVIQPLPLSCSVERSASSPDFTAFPSPLCSPAHCLHGFQCLSLLFPESFKVKFTAVYSASLSPPPPHFPYDAPPPSPPPPPPCSWLLQTSLSCFVSHSARHCWALAFSPQEKFFVFEWVNFKWISVPWMF